MSWWQQVAHFAPRYTCVAFAHRGFAPSDAGRGGPDPADYAGDLAALIDHLGFDDVRLVGQSMGGWTMLEYAIAHPSRVKALVLSSTSGTIDRRGADPSGGTQYDAWLKDAEAKVAAGLPDGIHPRWAPAAARFPALHLLYKSIDEMAGALDKEKVRAGLRRTAGARSTSCRISACRPADRRRPGRRLSALPRKRHRRKAAARRRTSDARPGHSPYFEQAATFNRLVEAFLLSIAKEETLSSDNPRIAVLGFAIECNRFSPVSTAEDFETDVDIRGNRIVTEGRAEASITLPDLPGFFSRWTAPAHGRPCPCASRRRNPAARSRRLLQGFLAEIGAGLKSVLPVDGVFVSCHGAALAEGTDDPDGDLFELVRPSSAPMCRWSRCSICTPMSRAA